MDIYLTDEEAREVIKDGKTTDGRTYMYDHFSPGATDLTYVNENWQDVGGLRPNYTVVTPDGAYKVTGGSAGAYTYEPIEGFAPPVAKEEKQYAGSASGGVDLGVSLREIYDAQTAAKLSALKSRYETSGAELELAESRIGPAFRLARNETAAQSEVQRGNFNTQAAARGLNVGASSQAELALGVALQGNLSALDAAEASQRSDAALERYKLMAEYESAIAEAKAEGSSALAQALYKEAVRQLEADADALDAQRAAEADQRAAEAASLKNERQNALTIWETMGYANAYVAETLGVEPGTPTSDQSYRDAQLASKAATAASKAATAASKGSGSSSASKSEKVEQDELMELFYQMKKSGYPLAYLSLQGLSGDKVNDVLYGYEQWDASLGEVDFKKVDQDSVLKLGKGPLSAESLEKLYELGQIFVYPKNGSFVVEWF